MTQDEIIFMAIQSGFVKPVFGEENGIMSVDKKWEATNIGKFVDMVIAAEREACANVCKKKFGKFSESKDDWLRGFANGAYDCEVAIRNRGAK